MADEFRTRGVSLGADFAKKRKTGPGIEWLRVVARERKHSIEKRKSPGMPGHSNLGDALWYLACGIKFPRSTFLIHVPG